MPNAKRQQENHVPGIEVTKEMLEAGMDAFGSTTFMTIWKLRSRSHIARWFVWINLISAYDRLYHVVVIVAAILNKNALSIIPFPTSGGFAPLGEGAVVVDDYVEKQLFAFIQKWDENKRVIRRRSSFYVLRQVFPHLTLFARTNYRISQQIVISIYSGNEFWFCAGCYDTNFNFSDHRRSLAKIGDNIRDPAIVGDIRLSASPGQIGDPEDIDIRAFKIRKSAFGQTSRT